MRGPGLTLFLGVAAALNCASAASYDRAFEPTAPGKNEIKRLPSATVLVTSCQGEYFTGSNRLFGRLFSYIRKHDVPMTVPVQADINPGAMVFFVGREQAARQLPTEGEVEVRNLPARLVASRGGRGAYSRKNFAKARDKLAEWLAANPEYRGTGSAYAVYWNGPYVPWFLKKFEVHQPVARVRASDAAPEE